MGDEFKPPIPRVESESKETKQFPKVSELEIAIANSKNEIKDELKNGLVEIQVAQQSWFELIQKKQDANHEIVMGELEPIKARLSHIERWKLDSSQKLQDHSIRTKQLSDTDMEVQAKQAADKEALEKALTEEKEAREALSTKVDDLGTETKEQTRLLKILANNSSKFLKLFNSPTARTLATIITIIGGFVISYFAKK